MGQIFNTFWGALSKKNLNLKTVRVLQKIPSNQSLRGPSVGCLFQNICKHFSSNKLTLLKKKENPKKNFITVNNK